MRRESRQSEERMRRREGAAPDRRAEAHSLDDRNGQEIDVRVRGDDAHHVEEIASGRGAMEEFHRSWAERAMGWRELTGYERVYALRHLVSAGR